MNSFYKERLDYWERVRAEAEHIRDEYDEVMEAKYLKHHFPRLYWANATTTRTEEPLRFEKSVCVASHSYPDRLDALVYRIESILQDEHAPTTRVVGKDSVASLMAEPYISSLPDSRLATTSICRSFTDMMMAYFTLVQSTDD